ncbi:hypothetical protein M673_06760 [Aureimonas sp. AU20]|nr:hypothetical protein M673_06760 [Aureimonas sp. AU20]
MMSDLAHPEDAFMPLARSERSALAPVLAGAPHRIGRVALTVRDLGAMSAFYSQAVGLELMEGGADVARLGAGGTVFLELRRDPAARQRSAREAGLFHTAFLLPTRADLGAWLGHAGARGVRLQGAADHLVSEAIYLSDPEGNGIEIYADRAPETWRWNGGELEMASDPLDADGLLRAGEVRGWTGFPEGGTVGHVHLQVGALEPADRFYGGLLGFDVTCRYPGASFFGSGGYHHQLAANVWNSRGAGARLQPSTGLTELELLTRPDALDAIRARLPTEAARSDEGGRLTLADPWGTAVSLLPAPTRS